jgi:cyclopropane fatty-acyl-phospholipid synthase-like methyltransferase
VTEAAPVLRALYEAVYGEPSLAHEAVRRDGHRPGDDIGQCGYTLPEQLRRLAERLLLGPGRRLLDLGCGTGGPTVYLARHAGCDALGIDFAQAGVIRARQRARKAGLSHRVAFLVAEGTALPLRPESCDAVMSLDVLLYVRDREALLRACRNVLRSGGTLALADEVARGTGLTPAEQEARSLFGPAVYDAEAAHVERLRSAGFEDVAVEDWTPAFVALNDRWCAAREHHRAALVAEGGEEAYDAGQRYFATNRDAARDGRLARLLFVAWKPARGDG